MALRNPTINELYSTVTPVAPAAPNTGAINWQTALIITAGVIITIVIVSSIVSSANAKIIASNSENHEAVLDVIDINHRYTTNILTQLQNKSDAVIEAIITIEGEVKTASTDGAKK